MSTDEPVSVVIDGSYLEGGGQILRNAFAFSALLQKPIVVAKIRGGREKPGLRPQHAAGLDLIRQISIGSNLNGATTGSSDVTFQPGTITNGSFTADPGTAGATTLLLQVSFPCLLFAPQGSTSNLTLRGGTNANNAPPIDFVVNILFPFLGNYFHLHPELVIRRRGYFPKGQGEVYVTIPAQEKEIPAINLMDRGDVTRIKGRAYVAGTLPVQMLGIMSRAAKRQLRQAGYDGGIIDIEEVQESPEEAYGNGSGIILWAETSGGCLLSGSRLGFKGTRAEVAAEEAADELIASLTHGGCVDEYLQDQIIIFMALAKGRSSIACGPLSLHTRTAIWIAETMTEAKFTVTEHEKDKWTIECQGIGLPPR